MKIHSLYDTTEHRSSQYTEALSYFVLFIWPFINVDQIKLYREMLTYKPLNNAVQEIELRKYFLNKLKEKIKSNTKK